MLTLTLMLPQAGQRPSPVLKYISQAKNNKIWPSGSAPIFPPDLLSSTLIRDSFRPGTPGVQELQATNHINKLRKPAGLLASGVRCD